MNVLLIGSGGREHALAWKASQSPRLTKLYSAPGNPGTAALGENLDLSVDDHTAILRTCETKAIDLVIVGPETPLAMGLADDLAAAGFKIFGPSRAAAEIEVSKTFSKQFMERHQIPTARFRVFSHFDKALAHLRKIDYPVVIKASGLAAGKGVLIPEDRRQAEAALRSVMISREFGPAGDEVVIEERLSGPELTLLAFSDGSTVRAMVASQDHKRVFDYDQGLNTGGMGAYAPAPGCSAETVAELVRVALQPTVDGLRDEGSPFIGVLYGGFMMTTEGPRVIEFNCRFGDPEAQVVLPLLESDFLEIAMACVEGRLDQVEVCWKDGAAACVVLASAGYPEKHQTGYPISGLDTGGPDTFIFHSGTRMIAGQVVTSGGRVLGVTGWGADVRAALEAAYGRIETIHFKDMHYRRDIGWRALLSTDG
ncbi:MAG: phosphoribosylamine--glycine ligase [Chloroflexota bacterium]